MTLATPTRDNRHFVSEQPERGEPSGRSSNG